MLDIKIDLIPNGDEKKRKTLSIIKIINTGRNELRPQFGDYKIEISDGGEIYKFNVKNFDRGDGKFALLEKVIKKFNGELDMLGEL